MSAWGPPSGGRPFLPRSALAETKMISCGRGVQLNPFFAKKAQGSHLLPRHGKRNGFKCLTKSSCFLLSLLGAIVMLLSLDVASRVPAVVPVASSSRVSDLCSVRFKSKRMGLCYFLPYSGNFGVELGPKAVDRILENHFFDNLSI